jgi:anti-sigma-K factor RskA
MNRDEIAELAAGYALHALDPADRERFESRLRAGDPDALAALDDCRETLALLAAESAEAPPPALKERLMARLEAPPETTGARLEAAPGTPVPDTPRATGVAAPRRRSPWVVVMAGAVAAGIAAIVVGLAVSGTYERRLVELEHEAVSARREVAEQRAVLALLRDPATQVVALAGQPAAPTARARMLWHARQGGLLVVAGLPALGEGKTYQLWAIAGRRTPVPAGTFAVDAGGAGSLKVPALPGVEAVDVFAVTLEPAGGLPAPSGPMMLAGKA